MKIGEVVRQGDVLIVRVSSKSGVRVPIPRENGRVVIRQREYLGEDDYVQVSD